MNDPYVWLWTVLIFGSIAWYAYLLLHVGWRGGRDIAVLARELSRPADDEEPAATDVASPPQPAPPGAYDDRP